MGAPVVAQAGGRRSRQGASAQAAAWQRWAWQAPEQAQSGEEERNHEIGEAC